MRIAQVAPPFERVPPERYGGTERVIANLTEELVRRGHEVTLFASGDSRTSARLVPEVRRALWHEEAEYQSFAPFETVTLGKLCRQLGNFDLVHSHLDYHGFPVARLSPRPLLTTLHGRLDLAELQAIYEEFDEVPLVSISDVQRRPVPKANWVATVYHGIPVETYRFNPQPRDYLAWLGRISPEKGLDAAIRVAARAGMPLKIAGREPLRQTEDPSARADWEYYEGVVQPLLRQYQAELVGELAGQDKVDFLRDAAALLFPITWPEPFGLVMPEALACGTPVLAFPNGSVPEVLEHGVTGWMCGDEEEMVDAAGRIGELDRARCRQEAERRFSVAAMTERYERVYRQLLGREQAAA